MPTVQFIRVRENARMPQRSTENSAGYDLFSCHEGRLSPGWRKIIQTGLKIVLPSGYWAKIEARSGLAVKNGITTLCGVIDEDYRGELGVVLHNTSQKDFEFGIGDKVAQLIIHKDYPVDWEEISEDRFMSQTTQRGSGGFGSTG